MPADSAVDLGGNTATNCIFNGTRLFAAGGITGNAVWEGDTMPLILDGETITVAVGASLTVQPNAAVKGQSGLGPASLVVEGSLVVHGPAAFTSLSDDTVLGDTNGDGAATSPTTGDWDRIQITGGSAAIDGVRVSYANVGLVAIDSVVTVESSRFTRCFAGVETAGTTTGFLGNSVTAENGAGVQLDSTGSILGDTLDPDPARQGNNDIYCNTLDVVFGGDDTLPAENNWWGETPPEPAEIDAFGGGTVDYDPYRTDVIHDFVQILVAKPGVLDARLEWDEMTSCSAYRVLRSTDPQFTTIDLDQFLPLGTTLFDDPVPPRCGPLLLRRAVEALESSLRVGRTNPLSGDSVRYRALCQQRPPHPEERNRPILPRQVPQAIWVTWSR